MTHKYLLEYQSVRKPRHWYPSDQFGPEWIDQKQESAANFLECLKLECSCRPGVFFANKTKIYRLYCDGDLLFEGTLAQLVNEYQPIRIET